MKKNAFYIVVTLWCTAPVFAAPSHTSATFPANGFMLEDYTYTNAATATNMAGVYENSVNANPNYNACPANSWCDASGQHACSTAGDGSYTSSAAGANENTACYKACTVAIANIAHAATVTGNDYYGAGTDTCSATSCENGYHTQSFDLNSTIGTVVGGYSNSNKLGYISNDGNDTYQNTTYGLTENGTFALEYANNKGMIKGRAACSSQVPANPWDNDANYTFSEGNIVSTLPNSTGQYCWCTLDEYTPVDGAPMSLSGPWVFSSDHSSAFDCADDCTDDCVSSLGSTKSAPLAFRSAVLGSMTGGAATCEITDITVGPGYYLPAGTETVATCSGGSYCPGLPNPVHYDANNDQGLFSCPTGYTYNTDTGKTSASQCQISCAAGTWVGEYTLLEYIETTGTQYIDTGVNVSTLVNPLVTATLQYTSTARGRQNGARRAGSNYFLFGISGLSDNFIIQAGGGGTETLFGTTDTNKHTFVIDTVNATCAIDDDVRTLNVGDLSGLNQTIFIGNTSGENRFDQARFFNVNIVSDGAVIMNLVPVQRNSDGVVGMYDMVTGAFFTNAGTGTFTAGADAGVGTLGNCVNVGAGYYSAASVVNHGSSGTRTACPIGTSTNGATNASSCTTCTGATYAATTASGTCTNCPSGYTYDTTTSGKTSATQCKIQCPAGTYLRYANTVPDGYTQLQYIETTGTSYIKTGVFVQNLTNPIMLVDAQLTTVDANEGACLAGQEYTYGNFRICTDAAYWRFDSSANYNSESLVPTYMGPADTNRHVFVLDAQHATAAVDGHTAPLTVNNLTHNKNYRQIIVGGANKGSGGYSVRWVPQAKYYHFNLISDGVDVLNMIPARRDSDNAVGMYDTVNGVFYPSDGTDSFIAGPVSNGCTNVGAGYYAGASVVNYGSVGTRTACPVGTSTNGVTNASSCTTCTGATYAATTASATCTACPSGYTHNTTSGKTAASQCQISCAGGTYIGLGNGYVPLEYIESTGTQYIDTGMVVSNLTNPVMSLTMQYVTVQNAKQSGAVQASSEMVKMGISQGGNFIVQAGGDNTETTFGVADTNKHTFVANTANGTCAIDDDVRVLNVGNLSNINKTIYINDVNGNTGSDRKGNVKFYNFNLVSGGDVVMNLVPARRTSDDAVGMYDTVTGAFFTNAGTGDFTAGPASLGCVDVGAGYWSSGGVTNYGSGVARTACPVGTTTVGYGHGADEATDCGRIMHFGNSVIYARSNKVTTPSLNIKLDNNDVYYISLSPTNHTLSRARVGSGDNKMTLYDDSLFYGERDFTTGERIVQ